MKLCNYVSKQIGKCNLLKIPKSASIVKQPNEFKN